MISRKQTLRAAGALALCGVANLVARDWYLHWGATPDEMAMPLPGDEFAPRISGTRAITIDAPVEKVWPWLVQIGQDRAGFYSYDVLEDLVLADINNADAIVPEWQTLAAGDTARLASQRVYGDGPLLRVRALEKNHHIVLDRWGAFVLQRIDDHTTRFLIRTHASARSPVARAAELLVLDPLHFVMERKMMLGIKARAERSERRPSCAISN